MGDTAGKMLYDSVMKTWESPAGKLNLERFPFPGDKSHQAWDAADEWILRRFPAPPANILIAGEAFGVLGTAWGKSGITALNDSFLSLNALEKNRRLNPETVIGRLEKTGTTSSLTGNSSAVDIIFIRLPKSLELLEIYVRLSLEYVSAGTEIWLGGMDRRWNKGVGKLMEQFLLVSEIFPFERHSRWARCTTPAGDKTDMTATPCKQTWTLEKYAVKLCSSPAVFSSAAIDPGTAAFLGAFPEQEVKSAERIADLGCGSGILGLCAAQLNSEAKIFFCDESYLAVRAASVNSELNGFDTRAEFRVTNGLEGITDNSLDLVLCNPPFHFQNIQTIEPAEFMFSEARRVLKPGGILQIVGNNHLGYHKHLKKYFSDTRTVLHNTRFTVLRASNNRPAP